ncbi:hypothetical protein [Bradyrhizobium elkanii]|uniref:hypothetical protein n=1 Tax=Bradyrhizobium elkanii TaxID=29448 RepID=UPI002226B97E|nr:hypothetical protein [Bradyrhizobium elkanii]MCW2130760.1 hypothetical protein [Bradyrhizobium elkanii]MCW2175916.1 hypothetical protein [Bradyrhizobium elkanii]
MAGRYAHPCGLRSGSRRHTPRRCTITAHDAENGAIFEAGLAVSVWLNRDNFIAALEKLINEKVAYDESALSDEDRQADRRFAVAGQLLGNSAAKA